jgi:prepilin-type N-terminal cleavage/methylation domain-containing protein
MKKGFTLLELLIVIIIIGTLAAIAMPRYFANIQNARMTEAQATTNRVREIELANFSVTGTYAVLPLTVTIGGSTITLVTPISPNFTYAVVVGATPATSGVNATLIAGQSTTSYYRCFDSGAFGAGTVAANCT